MLSQLLLYLIDAKIKKIILAKLDMSNHDPKVTRCLVCLFVSLAPSNSIEIAETIEEDSYKPEDGFELKQIGFVHSYARVLNISSCYIQ